MKRVRGRRGRAGRAAAVVADAAGLADAAAAAAGARLAAVARAQPRSFEGARRSREIPAGGERALRRCAAAVGRPARPSTRPTARPSAVASAVAGAREGARDDIEQLVGDVLARLECEAEALKVGAHLPRYSRDAGEIQPRCR